MPKRPKLEDSHGPKPSLSSQDPPPPRKRAKQVKIVKNDDAVVDVDPDPEPTSEGAAVNEPKAKPSTEEKPSEGSEVASSDLESFNDNASDTPSCGSVSRDPDYYFKDGNVIVRVGDVLFKIHSSSFETRSTVFKDLFNMEVDEDNGSAEENESDESASGDASAEGEADTADDGEEEEEEEEGEEEDAENEEEEEVEGEETEGGDDEDDDREGSESEEETEPDTAIEGTMDSIPIPISGVEPSEFRNLLKIFYRLPYEAPVANLDKEARGQALWDKFELLLDVSKLSHRFCIPDMEKWATAQLEALARTKTVELSKILHSSDVPPSYIVGAIRHSKAVSTPHLVHSIRHIVQAYCYFVPDTIDVDKLLQLFRLEELPKVDRALYGYVFLLLMCLGNEWWITDHFSHMDRMALFSAQSFLTPLPATLFDGLDSPLFAMPDSAPSFSKRVSSTTTASSCVEKCYKAVFRMWKEEFDAQYYSALAAPIFQGALIALYSLLPRRLRLGSKLRALQCPYSCHDALLFRVDQDIEKLYTRLAEYYKPIP